MEKNLNYTRVTEYPFSKDFELLPVADFMKIPEERLKEIEKCAKKILAHHIEVRQADIYNTKPVDDVFGLKTKYHLAAGYIKKMVRNTVFIGQTKEVFSIEDEIEKSLLAMLICDCDCKYYNLYQEKKSQGLSYDEILDYLNLYFGVRSPKLIQLERYYQLLNYRYAKSKVGIFDNEDVPKKI